MHQCAKHEGIHDTFMESGSVTRRRYSEFTSVDDVPGKRTRDNGALMTNKHGGHGGASVTQDIVRSGEPSTSYGASELPLSHIVGKYPIPITCVRKAVYYVCSILFMSRGQLN